MAGIGGIRVTPEQLQQVSSQLTAGAGNVDGILRRLAGDVAPLGSDWAGVAQGRFQDLWTQWQKDAQGLHNALTGIARLMAQASASYEAAEDSIARSFAR